MASTIMARAQRRSQILNELQAEVASNASNNKKVRKNHQHPSTLWATDVIHNEMLWLILWPMTSKMAVSYVFFFSVGMSTDMWLRTPGGVMWLTTTISNRWWVINPPSTVGQTAVLACYCHSSLLAFGCKLVAPNGALQNIIDYLSKHEWIKSRETFSILESSVVTCSDHYEPLWTILRKQ